MGDHSNNRGKSYSQMTLAEKQQLCCVAFNGSSGCSNTNCSKMHRCSKLTKEGKRVCWGTHPEVQHR